MWNLISCWIMSLAPERNTGSAEKKLCVSYPHLEEDNQNWHSLLRSQPGPCERTADRGDWGGAQDLRPPLTSSVSPDTVPRPAHPGTSRSLETRLENEKHSSELTRDRGDWLWHWRFHLHPGWALPWNSCETQATCMCSSVLEESLWLYQFL